MVAEPGSEPAPLSAGDRRFGEAWSEELTLRDGTAVTLRRVRPSDKALLRAGFEHLSARARYQRFLHHKTRLSDADLRYLTEVDGEHHFAIGAIERDGGRGLGVARLVKLEERADTAEAAFTIVDDAQGKGLGTILFLRLLEAARELDIATIRCEVLTGNDQMLQLIDEIAGERTVHADKGVAVIEFPVPGVGVARSSAHSEPREHDRIAEPPREDPMWKVFREVARGAVQIGREAVAWWRDEDGEQEKPR